MGILRFISCSIWYSCELATYVEDYNYPHVLLWSLACVSLNCDCGNILLARYLFPVCGIFTIIIIRYFSLVVLWCILLQAASRVASYLNCISIDKLH